MCATIGHQAPAVWFAYSPDRKGEHPKQHLKNFKGAVQARVPGKRYFACAALWKADSAFLPRDSMMSFPGYA